jgi:superfamily II DNA or RNA helicase
LVATIDTAGSDAFKALLASTGRVLLIADEVHNLGAGRALELLSDRFAGRLGLSATPERWKDEEGTEALFDYFGGVVFSFTIREAIAAGVLCPYVYEPVLVPLAGDELVEYSALMSQVERVATLSDAAATGELARLLARRATILNEAAGKTRAVREQLATAGQAWTLFYCASRTQLGAVVDLVLESGRTVRVFTAEEDRHTRQQLLTEFADRKIAVLAAMRALDEGVDIPETREAHILASSGNPREFIQRRGRVLRPALGKQLARIVDYITLPASTGPWERRLVRKEMGRVLDFAHDATNAEQARVAVVPILDRFDLLHMLGDHM